MPRRVTLTCAFCTACMLLCLLPSCGAQNARLDSRINPAAGTEPTAAVPSSGIPFPAEREALEATGNFLQGSECTTQSAGAEVKFEVHMYLDATEGGMEYAQYRFDTDDEPQAVQVLMRNDASLGAYVGLANYATG